MEALLLSMLDLATVRSALVAPTQADEVEPDWLALSLRKEVFWRPLTLSLLSPLLLDLPPLSQFFFSSGLRMYARSRSFCLDDPGFGCDLGVTVDVTLDRLKVGSWDSSRLAL